MTQMIKSLLKTVSLILFVPSLAIAAPMINGVNGTVSHNGSITVSGSGFGTKSTAGPVRWDSFDDSNRRAGDSIAAGGYWTVGSSKGDITYNTGKARHKNSLYNIKDRLVYSYPSTTPNDTFYRTNLFSGPGRFFISFWVYVDFIKMNASKDWQLKVMRVASGPEHSDWPTFSLQTWWTPAGSNVNSYFEYPGPSLPSIYGQGIATGQWMRVQVEFLESGLGTANGKIVTSTIRSDGKVFRKEVPNVITRNSAYPEHLDTAKFGYYVTNNLSYGHEVHTYWDDIYIDNSWARVELGDNPDYYQSTRREMQVPTAWANGSISVKVNAGSFNAGEKAYLFVIDNNGQPSAGIPVTIGAATAPAPTEPAPAPAPAPAPVKPAPKPPVNVIIVQQR